MGSHRKGTKDSPEHSNIPCHGSKISQIKENEVIIFLLASTLQCNQTYQASMLQTCDSFCNPFKNFV